MAIAKDFYIGNTHILIDDCICKNQTPEEKLKIKDNFAKIYYRALANQMDNEEKKEMKNKILVVNIICN